MQIKEFRVGNLVDCFGICEVISIYENKIKVRRLSDSGERFIIGKVKAIMPVQQVSASFKKQDLVVTTDEQYPQHVLIEFSHDATDLLNNLQLGQQVKVSINIRGRELVSPQGETKYFNSIKGGELIRL